MMTPSNPITYRRRGTAGTLTLGGAVDIAQASLLRTEAIRALKDTRAETLYVNLAHTESIDLSGLQILSALQRDMLVCGRACRFDPEFSAAAETMRRAGIAL